MEGTIYANFLLDNKENTKKLIFADVIRYKSKKDVNIFDYSKYIAHKKEIFFMKKKSFETGEPLDIKTLLSINENEKNLQIFYHNFLKYKIERMDAVSRLLFNIDAIKYNDNDRKILHILKDKVEYADNKIINTKEFVEEQLNLQFVLLKKTEQYINNIFKIVSYDNKLEYKYNVLLKLWNQEEISWWSWYVIKNIIKESDFSEILDIVTKFINSIL